MTYCQQQSTVILSTVITGTRCQRQTDRQTDRAGWVGGWQTDRQIDRHIDRQSDTDNDQVGHELRTAILSLLFVHKVN